MDPRWKTIGVARTSLTPSCSLMGGKKYIENSDFSVLNYLGVKWIAADFGGRHGKLANPFFWMDDTEASGMANANIFLFAGFADQRKPRLTDLDMRKFVILHFARVAARQMHDECFMNISKWVNSDEFDCPAHICDSDDGFIDYLESVKNTYHFDCIGIADPSKSENVKNTQKKMEEEDRDDPGGGREQVVLPPRQEF
eukprot:gnl/MRDRNA2_/MRDRNA2_14239_c0_seq1.p1 gnl/MRDRNA2_/MRDRNA2_14239_c0~~gnl/MRDRNA2_/MRDRNA2_14239_c0_seq1.p1  ORF type:complete len:198 (-),score=33.62 gnl/MRDRNA2_/MRDRNA2_14239_c0_seq1:611-1204(-)